MLTSRKKFLQQSAFALAGTCVPFSKLFANFNIDPMIGDIKHPKDCTNNLRDNFLFAPGKIQTAIFNYYKGAAPGVIKDVLYKDETTILGCRESVPQNNLCGPFNNHTPNNNSLRYKAYYPVSSVEAGSQGHNYDQAPLPVIVLFHAGGYQECSNFELSLIELLCTYLARKGFISITVDYRTGILKDYGDPTKTAVQQQLAAYRAQQDGRGAIRSIIQRQSDNFHDNEFKFNINQFFIGGTSAGGIVALSVAYHRTQTMTNQVFPGATTGLSIVESLGSFNPDFYYGGTNVNMPIIRGVLSCWGGIALPIAYDGNDPSDDSSDNGTVEATFFDGGGQYANPPMIGFHGFRDVTVPFSDTNNQNLLFSATQKYKRENFCLQDISGAYYILRNPAVVSVKLGSTLNMYNILKNLNRFTEIYEDCNAGHGLDSDDSIAESDWGTGIADDDLVALYIAQRTAVFFQTIMNVPITNPPPPFGFKGRSFFRDCVNNRICTDTGNNNSCTSSNDTECIL